MGIGSFLVKGEEAQSLKRSPREVSTEPPSSKPLGKQKKAAKEGIHRFFSKASSNDHDEEAGSHTATWAIGGSETLHNHGSSSTVVGPRKHPDGDDPMQEPIDYHTCRRCNTSLRDADEYQCHQDEHLARDLQEEERGRQTFAGQSSAAFTTPPSNRGTAASSTRPTKRKKTEAGQTKLKFA